MTKVNTSSEPSMEEILASIRKIIAEEPPGSRPTPPPKPVVAEDRVFSRDAFWRTPAAPTQRIEPTPPSRPIASPAPAAVPKFEAPLFPAAREPNPLVARDESGSAKDREAASKPAPRDIDEQLSDLLSDDLRSAGDKGADARDDHVSEERSLTVTRVEYEPRGHGAGVAAGADPFEFDLGPSPFSAREERRAAEATSVTSTMPESVVAAAQDALWSSIPVAEKVAAESVALFVAAERPAEPVSAPEEAARPQTAKTEPLFDRRDVHTAPSVAATIGPIRKLGPYPDILMPSPAAASTGEQNAPAEPRAPVESPNFINRTGTAAKASEAETVLFQRADGALTPAPISMSMSDLDHRTMEDTVADLLRPMLKQWLTENMPKIVERALRRELLERGPNHKSAAE